MDGNGSVLVYVALPHLSWDYFSPLKLLRQRANRWAAQRPTAATSALTKVQNTEGKIIYFDKYTQNSTCLRYGLGRRTQGGIRDAAVIYTEGGSRQHRLLIRSQEKKNRLGGTR